MEQEPNGDALIQINPEEDEDARNQRPDKDWDNAHCRRNESGHAVFEPGNENAQARKEERKNEKPEGDGVNAKAEKEVHALAFRSCRSPDDSVQVQVIVTSRDSDAFSFFQGQIESCQDGERESVPDHLCWSCASVF